MTVNIKKNWKFSKKILNTAVMCWRIDPKPRELNLDCAVEDKNFASLPICLVSECGKVNLSFEPLLFTWNYKVPNGGDLKKWSFGQLSKYLDRFPDHKPKQILK